MRIRQPDVVDQYADLETVEFAFQVVVHRGRVLVGEIGLDAFDHAAGMLGTDFLGRGLEFGLGTADQNDVQTAAGQLPSVRFS